MTEISILSGKWKFCKCHLDKVKLFPKLFNIVTSQINITILQCNWLALYGCYMLKKKVYIKYILHMTNLEVLFRAINI